MSRGPTIRINNSQPFEIWRDKRVKARERAARKLLRIRRRELRRAAHTSRQDARDRGVTRYNGHPCKFHPTCMTRYVASGHCIECDRIRADLRRMAAGTYGKKGLRKVRAPRISGPRAPFIVERPAPSQKPVNH